MKKIIAVVLLGFLLTSCQSESKPDTRLVEPTPTETQIKPAETTIDNDGGAFSKNDLIYFIMTDRFKDSDPTANLPDVNPDDPFAFQGGDLQGIISELDYIASLGTTAIWITPVMTNGPKGYHGYWIHDFESVDPHMGTLEDMKLLVEEAHQRNIKVILDYIVNHTGYNAPWLTDAEKKSWFHKKVDITNWSDPVQVESGWLAGLPDLDQDKEEVVTYFIDNALWWIDQTGIDGFRLDTVKHVKKEFWTVFSQAIKAKYPDFYLLGEVWSDNARYIELYHQAGLDGNTNYSLYSGIQAAFGPLSDVRTLVNAIQKDQNFQRPDLNGIFIDNHDNPRFVNISKEHGQAYLKQALTFMLTYPAIPVVYYGTEIAMEGSADPDNRRFMDWEATSDSDMLDFYRQVVAFRQAYGGDLKWLGNTNKTLAYTITSGQKTLLVLMNTDTKPQSLSIEMVHQTLTPLSDTSPYVLNGQNIEVTLPAFAIEFYDVK